MVRILRHSRTVEDLPEVALFFSSWSSLFRIVAVGIPAYVALVLVLRIGGKRTLSKFNAFDFVVTVAFGSILAAGLTSKSLTLIDVVAAFAVLVLLQFLITFASVRSPRWDTSVKSEPRLLCHRGVLLHDAMQSERITEREVMAAIREQGYDDLSQIHSVVLETNGTMSVVVESTEP